MMKTIYSRLILFGLLSFLATGLSFGQTSPINETFSNLGPYGGYQNETWTGDDGGTWTATDARTDRTINGAAIMVRDGELTSPSVTGGIGDLTVTTQRQFSGGSGNMDLRVNGTSVGSIPYDGTVQTTTISGINISGNVTVVIDATNSSSDRVVIDDLQWTDFSGTTPTVGFDAATSTENETNATFNVSIPVTLSNYSANVDLSVAVNASSSAESADYTLNTTLLSFTGNGTQNISLDINDDANSDDETIILDIAETTSTGITISPDQHTVTVVDDEVVATPLQYTFDFTSDPFNNDWQQFSVSGAEQWEYTGSGAQMNAFNSGCQTNEDWLITPFFDLDSYNNEELSFTTSESFDPSDTDLEVLYSTDYSGTGDPNNANWTTITTITSGNAGTTSNNTSLQGVSGNQVYVAFKYVFSSGDCSEWTITDFDLDAVAAGANIPPSITSITQTPATNITSSDAVTVSADITDSDGTINNVELKWGTASGSLVNTINMSNTTGDTYETDTDIPAQADGTTVYYDIAATDDEPETTTSAEQSYDVNDPVTLPYSEDFTGQNGKGATGGSSVTFDLAGVDWSLDINESGLGGSSDWFRVENEEFSARDVDEEQVWNSPVIDISGETDIDISVDVSSVTGELENSDYIETGYVLDGGSFTTITKHEGEITGTVTDSVLLTGLSNSTLKIVIKVDNGAGSEYYYFDNLSVKAPSTYTYTDDNTGWNNNPITGTPASTNADEIEVLAGTAVLNGVIDGNNLTISSGATLELGASAVLNLDGDITNNGTILFSSDTNGSAQLDTFTGSINGTGDVTVERFIPVATEDTRAFRFLTSAVDSDGSIFANWQEGGNSPAGFGTHITGAQGTVGNISPLGFDETATGNASMYTFNNDFTGSDQSNAWEEISDTDDGRQLNAGEAYRMFIRGDRNYNLNAVPNDADFGPNSDVTLRATGSLLTGNQTFTLSSVQDYYSLVGNPYQTIVNINDVQTTNMNTNFYWVWDPNMSTRGAYVAVDLSSGNLSNPDNIDVSSSEADQFVMPGQSFFVQTVNNGVADITFTESAKDVSATPTAVFSDDGTASINLKLYKTTDLNNDEFESDALQINFNDQFANAVTLEDADKLGNPDENLARLNNGEYLTIEKRAMPVDGETLAIFTDGYTATDYTFVTTISNMPQDVSAYLIDDHTGDQTLLNEGQNQISFTADPSSPGSIATDRFSIEFEIETFGVEDNEVADNFKVYPNPVKNDQVTIQAPNMSGEVDINLSNMLGQRVMSTKGEISRNGEMNLNIGDQQSGVYFIEVSQDGQTVKERLIIK